MKFKKIWLVITLFLICMTASVVDAVPLNFSGTILSNSVLNVPGEFTDIQAALDYLKNKKIADGVLLTIQVADGAYNINKTISITHPDGDKINIIGNPTNPTNCTLNFSNCENGFLIANGNRLGLLQGFSLVGDNIVTRGINVCQSSVLVSCDLIVQQFKYDGVFAGTSSSLVATRVNSSNNQSAGFSSTGNSSMITQSCTATYNRYNGFLANQNSFISVNGATSTNNGSYGFNAYSGGLIQLLTSQITISNNGSGNYPNTGSVIRSDV